MDSQVLDNTEGTILGVTLCLFKAWALSQRTGPTKSSGAWWKAGKYTTLRSDTVSAHENFFLNLPFKKSKSKNPIKINK